MRWEPFLIGSVHPGWLVSQAIADGHEYKMPATIDDASVLPEIAEALATLGYAQ